MTVENKRPTQLNLGWGRQERVRWDLESARKKRQQVLEYAFAWSARHPGKKASPRVIAKGLGISAQTATKRIKELLGENPSLIGLVGRERKDDHHTKTPAEGWTLATLGSPAIAYQHPDKFVSLGRVLRDEGIRRTPAAAAEVLTESKIEVRIFESSYPRIGLIFNRYIVNKGDQQRIADALTT